MSSKSRSAASASKGKGKVKPSKLSESESESESEVSSTSESDSEEEVVTKKKPSTASKKVAPPKKKKVVESSSESDSDTESESETDSEDERPSKAKSKAKASAAKKPVAKKPAAGKKKKVVSSSEEDSDSDSEDEAPKKKTVAAAKKKAAPTKKPVTNTFTGLSADEDEEDESESSSASEAESEDEKPAAKGKAKGKGDKKEQKEASPTPAAAPSAGGKKKGKKQKQEEDLDAILQDLSLAPTPKAAPAPAAAAAASSAPADTTADGTPEEPMQLSKAQLKRLKQKQKAEAAKAAPPSDKAEESKKGTSSAAAAAAADKKKGGEEKEKKPAKASKAVEALRERLRLQKEEEERRRKEEEERLAREEAERIRLEEEEKAAEEERQRKAAARLKAREEARKAKTLLSKSEKAAQAKRQAFLQQLQASGQPLPIALQQEEKGDDAASSASAAAQQPQREKVSKKDQMKKKSAYAKRMEAQKEADRLRAERHAREDAHRLEAKAEEDRRKAEDAELEQRYAQLMEEVEKEELALGEEDVVEMSEDEAEEEDEPIVDSWEDMADSDDERRKEEEKEERRRKKIEEKEKKRAEKEAKRLALEKKRSELLKKREGEMATLKEQRRAADEAKKKAAEAAKKAAEEAERQQKAVEAGFEIAKSTSPNDATSPPSSSSGSGGKDQKRKGGDRDLRSPIACILGHVDTGKTKILDNIRKTSVQSHEAGGITQQIGATFMPRQSIMEKTIELQQFLGKELTMDMPGLLVIDTPGHESFTNLRSRGSNLCDIAILVVDIMHGLEPQTIESINLLKQRKTPFVIALNKIDRMYAWKTNPNAPFQVTMNKQQDSTKQEFQKRLNESMLLLAEQGLNVAPYYENPDFRKYVSIVPTSAITGEGIPDLLLLLVQLTQKMMNERLSYLSELQCTVLEVKVVEGLGTTIDVILVNGVLHEGDTIVVCGMNGPIVTTIRALLTPPPMQEIRVKADYVHHKVVKAAMGVKISAQGLENAIAGSSLLVCGPKDDIEELKDEVQGDLATILSRVDKSGLGVAVQASTLGSLEALLSFLSDMKIPVSSIAIGPVYKKDVMKAAVMLERKPEYAVILAFDVKVSAEAQKIAEEMGLKIFTADIIYHLFDACTKYMEEVRARKRMESAETAVFPCVLDIIPSAVFNVKSPIVIGVRVVDGVARIGTPLCIPSKSFLMVGRITGMQKNHVDVTEARKGDEVAMKIEQPKEAQQIIFGRHFDASSQLVSKLSRESIDLLKLNFKDDLSQSEWKLVVKLKKVFEII